MTNLFRQAKQLLDKKDAGNELTEEELKLINTAIIPLMAKADGVFPQDITIGEGLEELAKMVEVKSKSPLGSGARASVGHMPHRVLPKNKAAGSPGGNKRRKPCHQDF